jgi:hypothetical protein
MWAAKNSILRYQVTVLILDLILLRLMMILTLKLSDCHSEKNRYKLLEILPL